MNIHPLIVHFPIALLALYSLLEIVGRLPWCRMRRKDWFVPLKAFLLFVGFAAALVAIVTGGMAEDIVRGVNPRAFILDVHEPFAWATLLVYFVLAAAYLVRIFDENGWGDRIVGTNRFLARLWNFKKRFWYAILNTALLPLLAFIGLVCLTITGGLGAALVYGPNVDPFVSVIYHLFWAQ